MLLPEWITESIKAGHRLPTEEFSLARIRDKPGQKSLTGFTPQKASRSAAELTAAPNLGLPRVAELHDSQLVGQGGPQRKPVINLSLQGLEHRPGSEEHQGQQDFAAHRSLQGLVGLAKRLQQAHGRHDSSAMLIEQSQAPADDSGEGQPDALTPEAMPEASAAAEQGSDAGEEMARDFMATQQSVPFSSAPKEAVAQQPHSAEMPAEAIDHDPMNEELPDDEQAQPMDLCLDLEERVISPEPSVSEPAAEPVSAHPEDQWLNVSNLTGQPAAEEHQRDPIEPHLEAAHALKEACQDKLAGIAGQCQPASAGDARRPANASSSAATPTPRQQRRHLDMHTPMEVLAQETSQQAAELYAMKARQRCDLLRGPPRSSRDDPAFQQTYFSASRLHFIGSWKARNEALLLGMVNEGPRPSTPAKGGSRSIIHIDMDCFFASVAGTAFSYQLPVHTCLYPHAEAMIVSRA